MCVYAGIYVCKKRGRKTELRYPIFLRANYSQQHYIATLSYLCYVIARFVVADAAAAAKKRALAWKEIRYFGVNASAMRDFI